MENIQTGDSSKDEHSGIFDKDQFLATMLNDADFAKIIINEFFKDFPVRLNEIKQGTDNNDHNLAQRASHTIKSTSAMITGNVLSDVAYHIEKACKEKESDKAKEFISSLEYEFGRFKRRIEETFLNSCPDMP